MLNVLLWAALYGAVYTASRLASDALVPFAMLAYVCLLLARLRKKGSFEYIGLKFPARSVRTAGFVIVFAALSAGGLAIGGGNASFLCGALLLVSALVEEIAFRGLFLRWLGSLPAHLKVVLSAAVFALFHIVNALDPAKRAMLPWQLAIAFAAGLVFAVITLKTGSILPAAAGHFLANLVILDSGSPALALYIDPGTGSMLFTVLVGIIGAAIYSIKLFAIKMRVRLVGKGKADTDRVPFAIFSDNKRYWTIFEPVCRELIARGQTVLYLTASEDDPVFSCGLTGLTAEYIGPGNKVFSRLNNLNAVILLSTTPGLEVYQWKRSAQVRWYVHIPHAASEIVLYRMFGIDYYDAILLSGDYQGEDIRALEALRSLPAKELVMTGIPYMDEMAARLEREGEAPEHPRTVLLAPSWGKSAIFGVYGGRIIDVLLRTGYHVIVRPHPQSFQSETELIESIMKEYPPTEQLEWNRDTDNFEVLRRSDILISDFSGVIFDFTLIYGKPVIYTDPDFSLDPYDAWWLKKPLWTASALPRLGQRLTEDNMQDLKALIDECLSDPRFAGGIKAVKAETWKNESEGAARAADYLLSKYDELVKEAERK